MGKGRDEWPSICLEIAKQTKVHPRLVERVLEKLAEGEESPENRRAGAGRKQRVKPGTEKADRLVGGLLSGFGGRHTATMVNQVGVLPGKKPIGKLTVNQSAKAHFGLVCGKRQTTKTGSRDKEGNWAVSRFAI